MTQNTTGEITPADMLTKPLERVVTSQSTSRRRDDHTRTGSDRSSGEHPVGIASRYIADIPHVLRVEVDLRMSNAARGNEAAARLLATAVDIASTDTVQHPDNADDDVQAGRVARFHHENAPIE